MPTTNSAPPRQERTALTNVDLDADADHADLVEAVTTLADEVADLRRENERLRDEVESLRDCLDDTEQRVESVANNASGAHSRVNGIEAELESRETEVEASEPHPHPSSGQDTAPDTSIEPETPLESVTSLPETMAETELTANQQRARFVAKDVESYTRRVPAGRAIKSSQIATVLRAGTECDGRSQTVSRVIRFLDDLGGDDVEVVERRGERRVVFSDELVSRLQRLTSTRGDSNAVVAEVST